MKNQNKMDCREINKALFFYAENTLQGDQRSTIEEHLRECADCRAFLLFLRETLDNIDADRLEKSDPLFFTRVTERLNNKIEAGSFLKRRFVSYLAAAAVFTGVIAGGISMGKLFSGSILSERQALNEEISFLDELKQEPIESFFLTLNEDENE